MADEHVPEVVYDTADPYHLAPPSEICLGCSDLEAGHLVPASFCEEAKARMGPPPWLAPPVN
ncbi:hypothetical protein ACPCSE_29390 [Streptomyces cellulosae]